MDKTAGSASDETVGNTTSRSPSSSSPIRRKPTPQELQLRQKELDALRTDVHSAFRSFLSRYGDDTVRQFNAFLQEPCLSEVFTKESQLNHFAKNATAGLRASTTSAEASTLTSGWIWAARQTTTAFSTPWEGPELAQSGGNISALKGVQSMLTAATERLASETKETKDSAAETSRRVLGTRLAMITAGVSALCAAGYFYGPSVVESMFGTDTQA